MAGETPASTCCAAACGSLGLFGNSLFQYTGTRLLANRAGLRLVLPARWRKYADYFSESSHARPTTKESTILFEPDDDAYARPIVADRVVLSHPGWRVWACGHPATAAEVAASIRAREGPAAAFTQQPSLEGSSVETVSSLHPTAAPAASQQVQPRGSAMDARPPTHPAPLALSGRQMRTHFPQFSAADLCADPAALRARLSGRGVWGWLQWHTAHTAPHAATVRRWLALRPELHRTLRGALDAALAAAAVHRGRGGACMAGSSLETAGALGAGGSVAGAVGGDGCGAAAGEGRQAVHAPVEGFGRLQLEAEGEGQGQGLGVGRGVSGRGCWCSRCGSGCRRRPRLVVVHVRRGDFRELPLMLPSSQPPQPAAECHSRCASGGTHGEPQYVQQGQQQQQEQARRIAVAECVPAGPEAARLDGGPDHWESEGPPSTGLHKSHRAAPHSSGRRAGADPPSRWPSNTAGRQPPTTSKPTPKRKPLMNTPATSVIAATATAAVAAAANVGADTYVSARMAPASTSPWQPTPRPLRTSPPFEDGEQGGAWCDHSGTDFRTPPSWYQHALRHVLQPPLRVGPGLGLGLRGPSADDARCDGAVCSGGSPRDSVGNDAVCGKTESGRGQSGWRCGGVEQCEEGRGGDPGCACARGCACAGDVLWVCSDDPHIAASARVGELQGISWATVLRWHEEQQRRTHQEQRESGEHREEVSGEELQRQETASVHGQQRSGWNRSGWGSVAGGEAARVDGWVAAGAGMRTACGGEGHTAARAGASAGQEQEQEMGRQCPLLSPDQAALLRGHAMLADWWLMRQADVLLASNSTFSFTAAMVSDVAAAAAADGAPTPAAGAGAGAAAGGGAGREAPVAAPVIRGEDGSLGPRAPVFLRPDPAVGGFRSFDPWDDLPLLPSAPVGANHSLNVRRAHAA